MEQVNVGLLSHQLDVGFSDALREGQDLSHVNWYCYFIYPQIRIRGDYGTSREVDSFT